jgi:hypothetical protein
MTIYCAAEQGVRCVDARPALRLRDLADASHAASRPSAFRAACTLGRCLMRAM